MRISKPYLKALNGAVHSHVQRVGNGAQGAAAQYVAECLGASPLQGTQELSVEASSHIVGLFMRVPPC